MKGFYFVLFTSISIILFSCSKEDGTTNNNLPEITTKHKSLVSASNEFGIDLFKAALQNEEVDANVILSPLSVSMAFSMLLNGAEGQIKDDILNVLHLGLSTEQSNQTAKDLLAYLPNVDANTQTNIANSIWYRNDFNVLQTFIDTNQFYLNAEVQALDFANPNAKDIINDWVDIKTNHKINSIIDNISSDEVMFLINAIYFNAAWTEQFETNETYNGQFTTQDGNQVSVDMMHSADINFGYYGNSNVEVIDLPYGNNHYHFTALLPNSATDINTFCNQLNMVDINQWISQIDTGHGLSIDMPKFEMDFEVSLKPVLNNMGLGIIFTDMADFSKINGTGGLAVSEVKHKTYMKVNEEGTEAAAATSIGIIVTSFPSGVFLNRPFVLLIREETTGAVLFVGRITDPS